MKIAGYLKTSLIEWPGKISSVIFTPGCNFCCPFCHNADLVDSNRATKQQSFKEEEIFVDLEKRKKWVDGVVLSVGSKEPVIVRVKGLLSYPKIEDLWNSNRRVLLDKEGETVIESQTLSGIDCLTYNDFQPVSKIIRHKTKEVYRVICGPGNYEILVTGSHSVFVVNSKGFFPKRVDELTDKDRLLSARKIPPVRQYISKISILGYVGLREINKEIREKKIAYWEGITSQIGRKTISELSRQFGHQRKTIRDYYRLSQNGYENLLDEWIIDNNYIRNKTSKTKIPITLILDSDFGELLGYAAAEGSVRYKQRSNLVSGYVFTLGNEPRLARRILLLYRKIFGGKSGAIVKSTNIKNNSQYTVIVSSRIVGELISALVGRGFANKKIPEIIYNVSPEVQKAFIKALIEGDGHERIRKNQSQYEYSLKIGSQKLARDLILLARMIDCFCWIEKDKESLKVVFSQNDLVKIIENKKELSLKYSFRTRINGIPRQLLGYGLKGQKRIAREELEKWFDLRNVKRKAVAVKFKLIDENGNFTPKLERMRFLYELTESWDIKEIRKMEKIDLRREEYVYDLVVDQNHSFVAGTGSLLVHNTGGEPTLQEDLPNFLKKVKGMGFLTMLETNGTKPEVIFELSNCRIENYPLVDYWCMDLKGDFKNYSNYTNCSNSQIIEKIKESIKLIARSWVEYEFRTTVVPGLHDLLSLKKLAGQIALILNTKYLILNTKWYLQQFRPMNTLDPKFLKVQPYSKEEMESFQKGLQEIIPQTYLRGI